jgi:tetratricopeptide (TPR) repeat protein
VTIDPEHADAWVNLGRLVHEAGDPAVAARCYHQALMRDDTDPVTHFNLALACEDLEKIGEAAAHYRRAVALNPRFADAHYNLAQLLSRLGRRDEAVRHMVRYRQLNATEVSYQLTWLAHKTKSTADYADEGRISRMLWGRNPASLGWCSRLVNAF